MSNTYMIEGMHCGACVAKIAQAFAASAVQANVTLNPPRLVVQAENSPDLAQLNVIIATAGKYVLTPLSENAVAEPSAAVQKNWIATYYPLLLIIGLISIVSLRGAVDIHGWMLHFMAGFFLVFGFFKLLDIKGFKDAYRGYDLLAKRWPAYGYVYPFLELGLGFAFLFQFELRAALLFSIVLMTFGSLGVIQALRAKRAIRCACLGTVLNLPMSTITLVEDVGMVVMSVIMLAAMA